MQNNERLKRLYVKHYEISAYAFFGVLTTVINYAVYIILVKLLGVQYIIGNIVAWICAIMFAFVTNKFYVFRSKNKKIGIIISEFFKFVSARVITGVAETILLYIFVDYFGFSDILIKVITNILVIIGNYLFNKYMVFNKNVKGVVCSKD